MTSTASITSTGELMATDRSGNAGTSTTNTDPVLIRHFKGHRDTITSLAFHPCTTKIASTSLDHSLHLWDFNQTARCLKFTAHQAAVNSCAWSSNGEILVTGSSDRTIRVWVPTVRGPSSEFRAHTSTVCCIDFHPKSLNRIISSSYDKTIKLWKITHKNFLTSFTGHTNWVRSCQFSPNGKLIASCSDDKTIRLFDTQSTREPIHTTFINDDKTFGHQIRWHPAGNMIAVAMNNGRCKIYDIRTNQLIQYYSIHSESINSIAFHPSGNYLLTGSSDGTMKILDLLEGRPIYTIGGHSNAITAVAFSADGRQFSSGGDDKQLMIWEFNLNQGAAVVGSSKKAAVTAAGQCTESLSLKNNTMDRGKAVLSDLSNHHHSNIIIEPTKLNDNCEFEVHEITINSEEFSSTSTTDAMNDSSLNYCHNTAIGNNQSKSKCLPRKCVPIKYSNRNRHHRKLSKRLDILFTQIETLRELFESALIRIERLESKIL